MKGFIIAMYVLIGIGVSAGSAPIINKMGNKPSDYVIAAAIWPILMAANITKKTLTY